VYVTIYTHTYQDTAHTVHATNNLCQPLSTSVPVSRWIKHLQFYLLRYLCVVPRYLALQFLERGCGRLTCACQATCCVCYTNIQHRLWSFYLMFTGPCIIAIVEEWRTNLTTLAILFHLLCAQHVSDIDISIFRSLRLCWWITTSVDLFSVRCVLELLVRLVFGGVRFAGWSTTVNVWCS
jgi:hypothetical protein